MARCFRCGAIIPDINVEFGGGEHAWSADGDIYCTQRCKDGVSADMTAAFAPGGHLSTTAETRRYIMGGREASASPEGRTLWPPPAEPQVTRTDWPWQRIALGILVVVLTTSGLILLALLA